MFHDSCFTRSHLVALALIALSVSGSGCTELETDGQGDGGDDGGAGSDGESGHGDAGQSGGGAAGEDDAAGQGGLSGSSGSGGNAGDGGGSGASGNAGQDGQSGSSGSAGDGAGDGAGEGGSGGEPCACEIDGECYSEGARREDHDCELCDASASQSDWSANDGASCDDGLYCTAGDSCDGTACGAPRDCDDGLSCTADSCDEDEDRCDHAVTTGCVIGGDCVAEGALDPSNPCMKCVAASDDSAYSALDSSQSCTPSDPMRIFDECNAGVCGTHYCDVRSCWSVVPTNQSQCGGTAGTIVSCAGNPDGASCGSVEGCGQDAQYPDAPDRTFAQQTLNEGEANEGDVIVDSHTGLMWQAAPEECSSGTNTCTQAEADVWCVNKDYAGFSDWRLPTGYELVELIQPGVMSPGTNMPNVDGQEQVWSSDTSASDSADGWAFTFAFAGGLSPFPKVQQAAKVRCVRGAGVTRDAAERFREDSTSGELRVLDRSTSLVWQRARVSEASGLTWIEALAHCQDLDYSSRSDWRLPNFFELLSLLDLDEADPASSLPGATSETYWSSSHGVIAAAALAYPVTFGGTTPLSAFAAPMTDTYAVRCVADL